MFSLVSVWMLALSSADPMFVRMVGEWVGSGERNFPLSGKKVYLETQTRSWMEGDILISRNQVKEIPTSPIADPTEPREYVRIYWMRPKADVSGVYEMGYGTGDTGRVTSEGKYQDNVFEVEQDLGGEPPYLVRSRTEFSESGSIYVETGWHGKNKIAETTIRYQRKAGTEL